MSNTFGRPGQDLPDPFRPGQGDALFFVLGADCYAREYVVKNFCSVYFWVTV
jgi:hypothetical protein